MKKVFHRDMIRPILYKTVSRSLTALAALLLWDRHLNQSGAFTVMRDGCMAASVFFFVMAWFSYLKLDGIRIRHISEKKKQSNSRHKSKDMADFMDQHIVSFEELSQQEQNICVLASNLLSGVIYLIPVLAVLSFLTE